MLAVVSFSLHSEAAGLCTGTTEEESRVQSVTSSLKLTVQMSGGVGPGIEESAQVGLAVSWRSGAGPLTGGWYFRGCDLSLGFLLISHHATARVLH